MKSPRDSRGPVYAKLLEVLDPRQITRNEPLSRHTYIQVGGKADIVVFPTNYKQAQWVVQCATQLAVPYFVMGNGSNLLIEDGGVRGIVIVLTGVNRIWRSGNTVVAQCGTPVIELAKFALRNQLHGLEFASGIPGTVGGSICMNAGAYGGQMSDVLERVVVLTNEGKYEFLTKEQLGLTYRNSVVANEEWMVLAASYRLIPGRYDKIKTKMDELTVQRASKQPLEYPSCGSVFKRPHNDYAGRLIQASGLQGLRMGGAQVSTKHAGFIINVDHARASDYIALIHHIQAVVKCRQGVELETEVKIIGEAGPSSSLFVRP